MSAATATASSMVGQSSRAKQFGRFLIFMLLALMVLVGGTALVFVAFPMQHQAFRSTTLDAQPSAAYTIISDVENYPQWRTGVERVEILPDDGKGLRYREFGARGPVTFRVEVASPGTEFRVRIEDEAIPVEGRWSYAFAPDPTGTELTIVESGEAFSFVFRLLAEFGYPQASTMEEVMSDLRTVVRDARSSR